MVNRNRAMVVFRTKINDEWYDVEYPVNYLRRLWYERKEDDTFFKFKCTVNNKEYSFYRKIDEVMKQVRRAELSNSIIPRNLEDYLIDLTRTFSQKNILQPQGRDEEIEKIWSCISKKKHSNAILVGDIDVGKTTTAYEIARQIATNECPVEFANSRVIMINTSELYKIRSNFIFTSVINKILKFLVNEKEYIVVYVDNLLHLKSAIELIILLHTIIEQNIKFMATTNYDDFNNYFASDNTISKCLNVIEIIEPQPEEIFPMIEKKVLLLQKQYKIKISKEMVHFAIATAGLSDSVSSEPGKVLNILDRAFSEAKRKGKKTVDKQCVLSCYNSYLKLYNNTSLEEKKMIAYHEVGHYIMYRKCQNLTDIKIDFVSILPMPDFLGINYGHEILGKTLNYTKEYFEDMISFDLGGRVGESKITQKFSTGASVDLDSANSCAKEMIMLYGLSENPKSQNRSYVSNYYHLNDSLMTEKMKKEINKEIQGIIDKGFKKAEDIINENMGLLKTIVDELLKKEILTGEELEAICNEYEQSQSKTTE